MISAARTMNRRHVCGMMLLLALLALVAGCTGTSDDVDVPEGGPGNATDPLDGDGPDNAEPVDPGLEQTPDVDQSPAADDD